MSLKVHCINLAHFEFQPIKYLLKNFFPEFTIIDARYNKQKFDNNLYISLNLDNYGTLNLNGIRKNGTIKYSLDNKLTCPILFFTGENYDIDIDTNTKHIISLNDFSLNDFSLNHVRLNDFSLNHVSLNDFSLNHVSLNDYNQRYLIVTPYKNGNNIFTTYWIIIPYISYYLKNYIFKYKNNNICIEKKYLLAYCSKNKVKERELFVEKFISKSNEKDKIYCLGSCTHSDCMKKKLPRYISPSLELIDEYSNFKFVIAMENCEKKGYITEKLLQAFISGSIPIYWGDHIGAKTIFNPNAFICIRDFNSYDECINYILNMSDKNVENMLKEPMFSDNIIPPLFDICNFNEDSFYGRFKKLARQLYY